MTSGDFDPAPRLPLSSAEKTSIALAGLAFVGLIGADLARGFSVGKLSFPLILAFWVPLLVLHELGHALAARSVGWHVSEVVIGFGRELLRFRVGSTQVRLRALPLEGYVVPSPASVRHARLAQAWIYFAGPLVHLLVLAGCGYVLDWRLPGPAAGLGSVSVASLGVAAALGAVCTLVPYSAGGNPSDGLGVLTSWLHSEASFRARLGTPFWSEGRRLLLREQPDRALAIVEAGLERHPDDARLRGLLAVCHAALGDADRAFSMLEDLGPPEARPDSERAELLADAAWAVLFGADTELLPDALRAAETAVALCPDEPHYEILLGRVFLERARPEPAYASLMNAYKRTRDIDHEAQCVAYLALSCAALRTTPEPLRQASYAPRFVAAVMTCDVPPRLRERVLREVGG